LRANSWVEAVSSRELSEERDVRAWVVHLILEARPGVGSVTLRSALRSDRPKPPWLNRLRCRRAEASVVEETLNRPRSLRCSRVDGQTGEYRDSSCRSGVKYLIEAGKALLTGTRPEIDRDPKVHGKVDL
jgi:hypothetical protein